MRNGPSRSSRSMRRLLCSRLPWARPACLHFGTSRKATVRVWCGRAHAQEAPFLSILNGVYWDWDDPEGSLDPAVRMISDYIMRVQSAFVFACARVRSRKCARVLSRT